MEGYRSLAGARGRSGDCKTEMKHLKMHVDLSPRELLVRWT